MMKHGHFSELLYKKQFEELVQQGLSEDEARKVIIESYKTYMKEKGKDIEEKLTYSQQEDNILKRLGHDLGTKMIEARRKAYKNYENFKRMNNLS